MTIRSAAALWPRMSWTADSRSAWLAWSLCALSLSLVGVTVMLVLLGRSEPLPEGFYPQWDGHLVLTLGGAGAPVLGAIIATRRPENPYGWFWCGFGLWLALLSFAQSYIAYSVATSASLPALGLFLHIGAMSWILIYATVPFLMLLFPDGALPSRRWRIVAWTVVAATVVTAIIGPFLPGESGIASIENPIGIGGFVGQVIVVLVYAGVFTIFLGILLSALSLIFRYRRATQMQRQQIKWFAYAAAVFGAGIIFSGFLGQQLPGIWHEVVETATMAGLYAGVGIAILRHRLYDIDVVINRTLVYGALTACVVGFYILAVGYLGALFQTDRNLLISLVAAGVVAVLFQPLRDRLQSGVNRLMYGDRDEPYAVVSRLGERLGATLEPSTVLPTIVETVREALRLPYVAIALPMDEGFEIAASSGDSQRADDELAADTRIVVPLAYGGETVGQLLLDPRVGETGFSTADQRLLENLARHAGVAVHGVRAMNDLRRSREELILAREEERRRLRRDLHDDLAPTLASLGLTAATVGELISTDPREAAAANEKLRAAIRSTVGDVRRLVYDLRPPALDELGLVEAIRDRAARYDAVDGDLQVTVDASEPLPPLPAAVEVAAYRIVQEALTNVSRHARAKTCSIRLEHADNKIIDIEIVDDGIGLPDRPARGIGLSSMQERAVELGGTFEIGRVSGQGNSVTGTRVLARLPLGDAQYKDHRQGREG